jgi:glycosyltransferase involved in cell wall biosynthesis
MNDLAFLVPGPLDQIAGGYLFDRRIVEGLRALGRGVTVHELPGRFPEADATARRAAAAVLAALPAGAAAVIEGWALDGFADCFAKETKRLRLLVLVHHPLAVETGLGEEESRRFAALEARLLPLARGVLCPSARSAAAVRAYGVAEERVALALPGTEKPERLPDRSARSGPLRLLSVATVTRRKGHLLLVEALAALKDREWRLRCVGSLTREPETAAAVRRAVAERRLKRCMTLAGEWPPDRLGVAYKEADVFVLPSYHEGYGMAFAEALAWGLPIVGTEAGAIPEVVPASAGLLVPPGDALALAAALGRFRDEPGLRERQAQGAGVAGAALPEWGTAVRGWAAAADRLIA